MHLLSKIIRRNCSLAGPKIHLAKLTDSPASSWLSTFIVEVRCSFHMTLAIRMPSSQPATSSSGSLRACRMVRVNVDGSTVRPHAAHLNSDSCSSDRERPSCFCLFPLFHLSCTPTLSLFVWSFIQESVLVGSQCI